MRCCLSPQGTRAPRRADMCVCAQTHLVVILVFQVPAADRALAGGVGGIWTFLGSPCDSTFNLEGREREPVRERAVQSLSSSNNPPSGRSAGETSSLGASGE